MESANTDLDGLRNQRLLLTGGTGFFGTWLLEALAWANRHLALGCEVWVLSRDPRSFAAKAPHLYCEDRFHVFAGDVRDFTPPGVPFDAVIHGAAAASAKLNADAPLVMLDTIVDGTRHVLDVALKSGARRFLFVSSGAVYGEQPPEVSHVSESFLGGPDVTLASNAYHEAKRTAELLCSIYAAMTELEVTTARCFAFVGPHLPIDAHFAVGNFVRDAIAGNPILIKSDGTPLRSYQYASDLVVWLLAILHRGRSGRAYNVGSDNAISVAELANLVAQEHPDRPAVQVLGVPKPGIPPARYVPSIERARHELGLSNRVGLREAIRKTLAWHMASAARE